MGIRIFETKYENGIYKNEIPDRTRIGGKCITVHSTAFVTLAFPRVGLIQLTKMNEKPGHKYIK